MRNNHSTVQSRMVIFYYLYINTNMAIANTKLIIVIPTKSHQRMNYCINISNNNFDTIHISIITKINTIANLPIELLNKANEKN